MKKIEPVLIITTHPDHLSTIRLESSFDTFILIYEKACSTNYELINIDEVGLIDELLSNNVLQDVIVISKSDKFDPHILNRQLRSIYDNKPDSDLILLLPYSLPPVFFPTEEKKASSFIMAAKRINFSFASKECRQLWKLTYSVLVTYLNSSASRNIEVVQVGKPTEKVVQYENDKHLAKSSIVIPHKGSVNLLHRCLLHLDQISEIPKTIQVCFDDESYKRIGVHHYKRIGSTLKLLKNSPANVGPYLAKHTCISNSDNEWFYLQDSDDISTKSRFSTQMNALIHRDLDMVGSHELRIDQIKKCVLAFRFPLEVNYSMNARVGNAFFHPTMLIKKDAYMKAGGFSTNRKFGYDAQFLRRVYFYLKIGNVDEFLYIRFRRLNSLTTSPHTKIGSHHRNFFLWRWQVEFELVKNGKLDLEDSLLSVQRSSSDFKLELI